jgi:hypothetical protein
MYDFYGLYQHVGTVYSVFVSATITRKTMKKISATLLLSSNKDNNNVNFIAAAIIFHCDQKTSIHIGRTVQKKNH